MQIQLNGEPYELPDDRAPTLAALIEQRGLGGKRLAVEVNETLIPRSQHVGHMLAPGDRVEIVQAIGGG